MNSEQRAQPRDRVVLSDSRRIVEAPLHIALVEPRIPPNTGNVARLCAATGTALHLVEPLGFSIDDRELKRAGLDYWERLEVVIHPSLPAFLAATSARRRWYLSTRAERPYTDARFALGDLLVFGSETAGLPQALLVEACEYAIRIPMRSEGIRSLNLSTSVGIVAYAALASLRFPGIER